VTHTEHSSPRLPDAAVATGAAAVAAFADRHQLPIPPDLREDLARQVLTAARPHLDADSDTVGPSA
jgi:hypothetical protein